MKWIIFVIIMQVKRRLSINYHALCNCEASSFQRREKNKRWKNARGAVGEWCDAFCASVERIPTNGATDEWAADETILRACRVGAKEKCFRVAFGVLLRKHHRWNRAGKLSDYASLSIGSINKATALAVAWIALNCALRSISLYIYKRDDMKMNLNKDLSFKAVHIDDDNHDSESMSPALLLFLSFGLRLNWL